MKITKNSNNLFIVITFLFLALSMSAAAGGVFNPIFPYEGSQFGGEYTYYLDNKTGQIKGVYNWIDDRIYYQGGVNFYLNKYNCSLSYLDWKTGMIPGYRDEKGLRASLSVPIGMDKSLAVGVFSGRAGFLVDSFDQDNPDLNDYQFENGEGYQSNKYLFMKYKQKYFISFDKYLNLNLSLLYGFDRENKDYSIIRMSIPQSYNDFKIKANLGYIQKAELIQPYFSLDNILTGYNKGDYKKGNRMIYLEAEKQKKLFDESNMYYLTLLKGAVFLKMADVLEEGEPLEDISLKSSAGLGLIYNLGTVDLRLDGLVTSEGKWSDFQMIFLVKSSF